MMMKQRSFKRTPMLLLLILSTVITRAQEVALKTNLLGLATTSLNAGLEIGTGRKSTFQLFGALNPWKFSGDKKLRYWNVMPEYRWYTCQKFGGHFFGIHALGGEYNVKMWTCLSAFCQRQRKEDITKAGMSVVASPTDTNGCCLSISISKDPSD